jgi:serine/threonine protein kinase
MPESNLVRRLGFPLCFGSDWSNKSLNIFPPHPHSVRFTYFYPLFYNMPLQLLDLYEERERLPKKRYAIYEKEDRRRWWVTLNIQINRAAESKGQPCVENAIYALQKSRERKNTLTQLFQNAINFHHLPLIDDSITRIRLYTSIVDDDSFHNTRNHYTVHRPLGSVLGFSLDGLRYIVDKDDDSTIDYALLQEYQAKYPPFLVIHYSDIIGKYGKTEKLRDGVYKTRDQYGRLLLYKEPKCPSDVIAQKNEIECLFRLAKSKHIIPFRGVVVSQIPYLTDSERVSSLVVRGFLTDYAVRGSLGEVLEEPECGWHQRVSWGLQIAKGLHDIHEANLCHADLNSHNVVIDEHNNAFIIDLSRTVRTYGWCAPEAWVETDPLNLPLEVTQRADIYSLGVVLWELATRYEVDIPIGMEHEKFFMIEDRSVPEEYERMVQRCLKHTPGDRPGIEEIIDMLVKLRPNSE